MKKKCFVPHVFSRNDPKTQNWCFLNPSTTESAGQISLSFSARASNGWLPTEKNMGVCFKIVPPKPIWLVVSTYPSEKWWTESQLGLWHSQYDGKVNPNSMVPVSTNQQWFNGQSSCSYEMAGRISPMYPISKKTPVKKNDDGNRTHQRRSKKLGKSIEVLRLVVQPDDWLPEAIMLFIGW